MGGLVKTENPSGDTSSMVVKKPYKMEIVWFNAIGFLALHIAAIYGWYLAFLEASLLTWIWSFAVGFLCGFGTGIGAHRYFTHRCFEATWPVRLGLLLAHTIAGQNCMYVWVRDHRQHHKYTDTDADPHNATRGFFFSHIGWLMCRKHPDVIEKGKTIDVSDLEADQFVMFQKKYYKTLYVLFAITLPVAVPCFFWGQNFNMAFWGTYVARSVTVLNITWLVNSAAHLYGVRPYNKKIEPVENKFVAFLSFGEGWHNYHHTFPWDYRASELGQKYTLSTKAIDWLASKGWIYNMKKASPSMIERWAKKFGDGTHAVYGYGDHDLGGTQATEVEYSAEECCEGDAEAYKNIETEAPLIEDEHIVNVKQSYISGTNVFNRNTVKVR